MTAWIFTILFALTLISGSFYLEKRLGKGSIDEIARAILVWVPFYGFLLYCFWCLLEHIHNAIQWIIGRPIE